jgi:hypothetical protein
MVESDYRCFVQFRGRCDDTFETSEVIPIALEHAHQSLELAVAVPGVRDCAVDRGSMRSGLIAADGIHAVTQRRQGKVWKSQSPHFSCSPLVSAWLVRVTG